jgi:hypothetical protein
LAVRAGEPIAGGIAEHRPLLESLIAAANRVESLARRVEELEGAEKLLREWFNLHDYPCRLDHHGNCQEHYLQTDCIVTRTRAALAAKGVGG